MHELDEWLPIHEAAEAAGRSVRRLQEWDRHGLLPKRRINGRTEYLRSGLFPARDMLHAAHVATQIHKSGYGRPGPGRANGPKRDLLDALLDAGVPAAEAQAQTRCSDSMLSAALGARDRQERQRQRELRGETLAQERERIDVAYRERQALRRQLFPYFEQGHRYAYLRDNGITDLDSDGVKLLVKQWKRETRKQQPWQHVKPSPPTTLDADGTHTETATQHHEPS